ncbi:MAG: DUF6048 family protein [Bacteroidales bacterium]
MNRTCASFISLLLLSLAFPAKGQDTIRFPLNLKVGIDLFGPAYNIKDKNKLEIEGFVSLDIDSTRSVVFEAGWLKYKYSQYNYDYTSNGAFLRGGVDFNLVNPALTRGKYFAGIGLRYGLGIYSHEFSSFSSSNYWGQTVGSVQKSTHAAHFIEANPGVRAELFNHIQIGWIIRLKILVYSGASKDLKPVDIPGYGNGTKGFSPGLNYYLIWTFRYKDI